LRWRALFAQETGLGARARELIGEPIDKLEAAIFRSQGSTLADRAVVLGVRRLGALSMRALSVQAVFDTYRQRGQHVRDLADIRALPLDEVEGALHDFAANYIVGAGVGGAVAGAFGALGVVGGVAPLLFASLHAIHRLALFYGHDPRDPSEERFAVLVLAAGLVTRPSLQTEVLQRLQAIARSLESKDATEGDPSNADKITENVAESLASQIALGLVTRSWPLAGLVVGAGYSRAFVARMCEMAQAAYGQRALLRRYGDASHVDSAL
jgi:hypothetical protein